MFLGGIPYSCGFWDHRHHHTENRGHEDEHHSHHIDNHDDDY